MSLMRRLVMLLTEEGVAQVTLTLAKQKRKTKNKWWTAAEISRAFLVARSRRDQRSSRQREFKLSESCPPGAVESVIESVVVKMERKSSIATTASDSTESPPRPQQSENTPTSDQFRDS